MWITEVVLWRHRYCCGDKAANIGLQAASIALNTVISMGITLAISALISQISKWVHAQVTRSIFDASSP